MKECNVFIYLFKDTRDRQQQGRSEGRHSALSASVYEHPVPEAWAAIT